MNQAAQLFVHQLMHRFESDCNAAQARIRTLTTIPDVVRAAAVQAPAAIRAVARTQPCARSLESAARQRLEELVQQHLATLEREPDLEKRQLMVGQLRRREWDHLRGAWAMQWRLADQKAQRLLHPPH